MTGIAVTLVPDGELPEPLEMLEETLRDGEPLPDQFVKRLGGRVASGELEVLVATSQGRTVGVALVVYRPSVSAAADFASIEELYVRPEARGWGAGRALLEAVEERCAERGVSYLEVQTDDEAAAFYAASGYEAESGVRVMSRSIAL